MADASELFRPRTLSRIPKTTEAVKLLRPISGDNSVGICHESELDRVIFMSYYCHGESDTPRKRLADTELSSCFS